MTNQTMDAWEFFSSAGLSGKNKALQGSGLAFYLHLGPTMDFFVLAEFSLFKLNLELTFWKGQWIMSLVTNQIN